MKDDLSGVRTHQVTDERRRKQQRAGEAVGGLGNVAADRQWGRQLKEVVLLEEWWR